MSKFVRNLITEWRKLDLPFKDAAIVVAVSGGADSVSLLLAIHDLAQRKKLALRVIVAHFNHKFRGRESDADEKFVRNLAAKLGLEFVSGKRSARPKTNLEQFARDERYKFLLNTARANSCAIVLTAHTKNDQAETFLLNLIRGSGVDGLGGMSAIRELDDGVILVRPLLSWAARTDTEEYSRENGIEYRSDRMNEDERFTRVRIRKTIIPALAEINPKIVDTLARTSELLRHQSASTVPQEVPPASALETSQLKSLSKPELYAKLRTWLRHSRGNLRSLDLKHIVAIERLIFSRKSGKTAELPGGGRVVKTGGRLVFSNIKVEK